MESLRLTIPPYRELVLVWRDGAVLDERVRSAALPLVALAAMVRVTPESPAVRAGWDTLEQAVATLREVYGTPLSLTYEGDPEPFVALYRRAEAEPGLPEPV